MNTVKSNIESGQTSVQDLVNKTLSNPHNMSLFSGATLNIQTLNINFGNTVATETHSNIS